MATRILEILHLFYCCYSDELTTEPCERISSVPQFSKARLSITVMEVLGRVMSILQPLVQAKTYNE